MGYLYSFYSPYSPYSFDSFTPSKKEINMTPHKSSGGAGVKPLECVSPRKAKWRIRWDITEKGDGTAEWTEQDFDHKPTAEEIRQTITDHINAKAEEAILTGFTYEGAPVWLSQDNQRNYLSALTLAMQTQGAILPVAFKFGTDATPVYRTFSTQSALAAFCSSMVAHIQSVLARAWSAKDAIDLTVYATAS